MKRITAIQLEEYRRYLLAEEKSEATMAKYLRDLSAFMRWLEGRAVEKELVLAYKEALVLHYAPASVNSMLSSLNGYFVFKGWFDCRVKALKIQRQIFVSESRELTKREYERLLTAAESLPGRRLYYVMQTICATGIRVSELRFITADAVAKGQVQIRCKGKMRTVFLPRQLCTMLSKYMRKQGIRAGSVFVSRNGRPLDRSNIWADMKKLCITAGVAREKVFPHNLRHLFARTYYSLQKDVVRLADILGHSSINTTRIYTMETGEIHCRQLQKLGLLRC